ncbi:unnamed protein product [Arctia plantaginis]|uniref:Uncharacterized protein n=1 Tax=Arctia plantaginis TaxID=874455 RepID=A0A8S0ZZ04_ARCPL|nr:unnamed protein product [Arctia plantaginis]
MSSNGTVSAVDGQPVRTLGGVELREDVPLKSSAGATGVGGEVRCCAGGPRLIPGAFAALSACITLALLTQIYCGDYEVVPHGSVSSSAASCSRAGTDALKAGGRAFDAAAAAALCLAVLAPHRTSLDASGSLLYWEYRDLRTQQPVLYEWGNIEAKEGEAGGGVELERPPRLVAALAYLHSSLGALPWARVLAPAIQLARDGFPVSEGLSVVEEARGEILLTGSNTTSPELADYLLSLQVNTSAELSQSWNSSYLVRRSAPTQVMAGSWRVLAGGRGANAALRALQVSLEPPPTSPDEAQYRVVAALQRESGAGVRAGGVATGLAVVDSRDTYIALVTGISEPFGSGEVSAGGWRRDEPLAALDLAPAILYEPNVCGSRYVVGAEASAAMAQAVTALALEGAMSGVERARVSLLADGALAQEALRAQLFPLQPALAPLVLRNASFPYTAVNLVLQRGDALTSHADSRGGGLASRF